jgi:uncharacterized protein YjiS (DUF1127 family)
MTMVLLRSAPKGWAPSNNASDWRASSVKRSGQDHDSRSPLALLQKWRRRRRSRVLLSQLDGHMLRDIGLSYADAEHEANKPFWLP